MNKLISASQKRARMTRAIMTAMMVGLMTALMCSMVAFAGGTYFGGVTSTLGTVISDAISMLQSFVVPLATVAALCAILIMYLPGMSSKTTDKCKTVIWSCVATVAVSFALNSIFTLAKNIGSSI